MNDQDLNGVVNKYIKENLSPKPDQKNYISQKYEELQVFLKGSCFQSGSYARFTAHNPVHDLDVIHPVADRSLQYHPSVVIDGLYAALEEGYSNSTITKVKRIYRQSHSVTVEFADTQEDFSIDVVPAIELTDDLNEFNQPFYLVPEILRLNKYNRNRRYEEETDNPIGWIKSDPRGYIRAALDMNEANSDFRHTAKLLKSWRHNCKVVYGDDFCLKSFHLEQIIYEHFTSNNGVSTIDAVIDCFGAVTGCLSQPQFPDRADSNRYIDEYINDLTQEQRQLILSKQAEAYEIIRKLPGCENEQEIVNCLEKLLLVRKQTSTGFIPATHAVTPRQPWSY